MRAGNSLIFLFPKRRVANNGLTTDVCASGLASLLFFQKASFISLNLNQPLTALSISSKGDFPVSILDHNPTHNRIPIFHKKFSQILFQSLSSFLFEKNNRFPSLYNANPIHAKYAVLVRNVFCSDFIFGK